MKNYLFVFSLLIFFTDLQAQKNVFVRENKMIAAGERRVGGNMIEKGIYSNASPNFNVYYYRCEWAVDPAVLYIQGKVTPYFTVTANTPSVSFDLSDSLIVDSVLSNGNKLNFAQDTNETVTINFLAPHNINQQDSVSIYYHGVPPQDSESIGDFTINTHAGVPVLWTLSEPYGARDWWPCRNGLDDKPDSIDIYITNPAQYRASSNGLLIDSATTGSTKLTHYKHRYPIASYLVAIAVTNYSTFLDTLQFPDKALPVFSYVYPEDSANFSSRTHFMLQVFHLYNDLYDEYPFMNERYGQTQFGFSGGMEHQTNSFVLEPDEDLMAHELAHQWFGDKITCASWQDIWLNEGFATYNADFLYMQNFSPSYYPQYVSGDLAYVVSQPNGSVFVTDTTSVNRIFDDRLTYCKGAFLVRMLRWTLGDSLFFKAIHQYLEDPLVAYGFAHTADLQRNLETVSRMDLNYFFNQWFYGQGYPSFTVKWNENTNNFANITISQATSDPSVSFFKVPLQLTFKNATQSKTFVINDTINNQQASLDLGFVADSVLIDPSQYLISAQDTAIKIPSVITKNLIQIYPNPFSNNIIVSIRNPVDPSLQFQLFNALGQRLIATTFNLTGADATFSLPVGPLANGVYFARIEGNTTKFEQELVK
jgi:aminopeptidase N